VSDAATLSILLDIKARLDELSSASREMSKLGKETKDTSQNIEQLSKETKAASEESNTLSNHFKTGLGIEVARRGMDLLTGSFREFVTQAFREAAAIKDGAENLGMSTEAYQVLRLTIQEVGGDMGRLDELVSHNNRSLEDARSQVGASAAAYRKLGLDAASLEALPVERRLESIGRAIINSKDQTEAYGAASVILGTRKLPMLLSALKTLSGEGYDNLSKAMRASGQIMESETIARLDRASKQIEKFKRAASIAAGEAIGELLGQNPDLLKELGSGMKTLFEYSIVKPGEAIGSMLGNLLNIANGLKITSVDDVNKGKMATLSAEEAAQSAEAARQRKAAAAAAEREAEQIKALTNAEYELKRVQDSAKITETSPLATDAYKAQQKLIDLDAELKAYEKLRQVLKEIDLIGSESAEQRRAKIDDLRNIITGKSEEYSSLRGGRSIDVRQNPGEISTHGRSKTYSDKLYRAGNVENPSVNKGHLKAGEGIGAGAADWVSSLGSKGEQVASAMNSTIGASVQEISAGIWDWATGAASFGDTLVGLGSLIVQTILQTVIQIGVQWLISAALAKTGLMTISATSSALRTKETTETVAAENAKTPSLMTNAAASNAGSFGMSAVIGIALLLAMMAMFAGGREKGGPVQSGRAYVVGEKRPELFVPHASGTIIPSLDGMAMPAQSSALPAAGVGLAVGAAMAGASLASRSKPQRVVIVDNRRAAEQLRDDPAFTTIIQDMLRDDPRSFGIAT
jgi:hypothetical protein